MVSLNGKIQPFRINKEELIELISQIIDGVEDIETYTIEIERFSEGSSIFDEIIDFLNSIYIPKVIKDFTLWIHARPTIYLSLNSISSTYSIIDAEDMNQARSIEDVIMTFFRKYGSSRLFSPEVGYLIGSLLFLITLIEIALLGEVFFGNEQLKYIPIHLLIGICSITFILYIVWSSLITSDTPSFSFNSGIIYLEQPKTNIVWFLAITIIIEIAIGILLSLFNIV